MMARSLVWTGVIGVCLGLGLLAAGPLGWRLGWWHYRVGFETLLPWAGYVSLAGVAAVVCGLLLGRRMLGRGVIALGLATAVLGLGVANVPRSWDGERGRWARINDITTDMADPPAFKAVLAARQAAGAISADYAGAADSQQQQAAYPDIAPVRLREGKAQAFARVAAVVARMPGWTVVAEDPAQGLIEASEASRWFGFVDDVVIRVRPDGEGSRVDVRSKSRIGRGDFGANARRVRAFLAAMQATRG